MKEKQRRQSYAFWIFLGVVVVGFAVFSLGFSKTIDNGSDASTATAETAAPQPDPTGTGNDDDELFHGIACQPDCSDQEQGYSDAQGSNVKSRDDCPSDAQSMGYRQGCWAYADEQMSNANEPAPPPTQQPAQQLQPDDSSDQNQGP